MNKKLIRKLVLSAFTIGLTVMSLTASTFAWLNLSSTAKVAGFEFNATTGNGFKVSIDGVTYRNKLSTSEVQKAMLVSYGVGQYKILTDGSENLVDIQTNRVLTDSEISSKLSQEIQLLPVTSIDGRKITDLFDATTSVTTGRYAEFSVYFKTESASQTENQKYEIYLNGESGTDPTTGEKKSPTEMTSVLTNVKLRTEMDTYYYDANGKKNLIHMTPTTYYPGYEQKEIAERALDPTVPVGKYLGIIPVYSTNAMRLSITESHLAYYKTSDTYFRDDKVYYVLDTDGKYRTEMVPVNQFLAYYELPASELSKPEADRQYVVTTDTTLTAGKDYYILTTSGTYTKYVPTSNYVIPTYYEYGYYIGDTPTTNIYELNDTSALNSDLGSYATKDYTEDPSVAPYTDNYYLYSNECNAMYSYYNRLRPNDKLDTRVLTKAALPETIKNLTEKDSGGKTVRASGNKTIATLSSGDPAKFLTFRLWLEGWDADCFDGLINSVNVKLSFGSQKIS